MRAILLLGSNLGNRIQHLRNAIELLEKNKIKKRKQSSVYESGAIGYESSNPYLNLAIEVEFFMPPLELLDTCLRVETILGRERTPSVRYTDRPIDIDIILIEENSIQTKRLTVPHPRMAERKFCLLPVAEIAPNIKVPPQQKTTKELLDILHSNPEKVVKTNVKI